MANFVNVVRFNATSSGTGDFVVSSAVQGYQTPAAASAGNGLVYSYRAESSDLSQWEIGTGAYTSGSTTQARTTVIANSSGTTSKINFSAAPQVALLALAGDIAPPVKGHIYGLTLSNNATDVTNDIDIAAGEAASTETDPVLMVLASALTKRLDAAWAVGSGNGGLDTGSIANTTYHIWLIQRSDTGVVDALFSTSASSPTMPTNYNRKRRIGSIIRAGGQITTFIQVGDTFMRSVPSYDISLNTTLGTTATLQSLAVPIGIRVEAIMSGSFTNASLAYHFMSSPENADTTPSSSVWTHYNLAAAQNIAKITQVTDTNAQIRLRSNSASSSAFFQTVGWIDTRGRHS